MVHILLSSLKLLGQLWGSDVVSSCWCNSLSKMVIKCAAIRTRKAFRTLEKFYFSRVPCLQSRLQACPDELEKQEFPRASSAVSSELRPDAYVFSSNDLY